MTSTPQQGNNTITNGTIQRRNSSGTKDVESEGEKCANGVDNHGYLTSYYGSQNEFDASIFGLNPSQYIGPPIPANSLGMRKNFQLFKTNFNKIYLQQNAHNRF